MKSTIVIGPIHRAKRQTKRFSILRDRVSKMKTGNYFEISGISDKKEAGNIRASLTYLSKTEKVKISTTLSGSVLRVEKVKDLSETKAASRV
jgi:hypothetical protein